jgi:hypothetical protein
MSNSYSKVLDSEFTMGRLRGSVVDVTFDNSYATGGESLAPEQFGLRSILGAQILGGGSGYHFEYVVSTGKIKAYRSAGFTPAGTVAAPTFTGDALAAHRHSLFVATGATDATGARVNAATNSLAMNNAAATVAGIAAASGSAGGVVDVTAGTPTGTNSAPAFTGTAVSAAALSEVGSGVDLSTVTLRVMAYGLS